MAKFLLEVLTEEIPASYIPVAARALGDFIEKKLDERGMPRGNAKMFGSPRRITLIIDGLVEKQEARTRKISGPPKKSAVAADGSFTPAALGFARKFGKSAADIQIESTEKGEYLFLMVRDEGRETAAFFEEMIPEVILSLPFPKTMRWGSREIRFARPIRSILAMMEGKPLNFSVDGIPAGNSTAGHRFLFPARIALSSPDDYESALEPLSVIADPEKRKKNIMDQFDMLATTSGMYPIRDEKLVEEVSYLTEFPVAVSGSFKESYLVLPRELLITVMKHHQRYFPVEGADKRLMNRFVAFSNIRCDDMGPVRNGYERVLEARLSDARFFFDEDRKHPLTHFAQKLSGITYQKGLGTVADKTGRIVTIATQIAHHLCPDRMTEVLSAAELCKADLTTQMVFEFPELQGIMGREYALAQGIHPMVAEAIDHHYRPRFSGDLLPESPVSICVALADKIETLAGCFALGFIPSGSEDPYSLRRHALGIVRIMLDKRDLPLDTLLNAGIQSLPESLNADPGKLKKELIEFFHGRVKGEFIQRGISFDVVDAVLAAGFVSLPDAFKRCEALVEMKKQSYAENLSVSFRRAANIVRDLPSSPGFVLSGERLPDPAEAELYRTYLAAGKILEPLMKVKDYNKALEEMAGLRTAVDTFFEKVMVMDPDAEKRKIRTELLRKVTGLFENFADFSKLVF